MKIIILKLVLTQRNQNVHLLSIYKSEAVKRAKAKYYQKMKQDETYMQNMRDRANKYYHEHRKITEIEKHLPNITAQ